MHTHECCAHTHMTFSSAYALPCEHRVHGVSRPVEMNTRMQLKRQKRKGRNRKSTSEPGTGGTSIPRPIVHQMSSYTSEFTLEQPPAPTATARPLGSVSSHDAHPLHSVHSIQSVQSMQSVQHNPQQEQQQQQHQQQHPPPPPPPQYRRRYSTESEAPVIASPWSDTQQQHFFAAADDYDQPGGQGQGGWEVHAHPVDPAHLPNAVVTTQRQRLETQPSWPPGPERPWMEGGGAGHYGDRRPPGR